MLKLCRQNAPEMTPGLETIGTVTSITRTVRRGLETRIGTNATTMNSATNLQDTMKLGKDTLNVSNNKIGFLTVIILIHRIDSMHAICLTMVAVTLAYKIIGTIVSGTISVTQSQLNHLNLTLLMNG